MKKLGLDTDGLIKLQTAGVLELLQEKLHCIVPEAVYEESVIAGKQKGYQDAHEIDEILNKDQVINVHEPPSKAQNVLSHGTESSLGKGEKETLFLYFLEDLDGIISDDVTFLNLLERYNDGIKEKIRYTL